MNQENTTQSGAPRRRRRGGRRSGSASPQHRNNRPYESKNEPAPATGIVGFFKKLFGIKPKPAPRAQAPARTDRTDRSDRFERAERPERNDRGDRNDRPVRAERPDRHSTSSSEAPVREPREPKVSERHDEPASSTPEEIEVTTPKLYVGNLSYDSSESDVFDLFSKSGQVKNVEIVRDRNSNSKGFGFVEMNSIEGAKEAAVKYHRFQFMDRQLIVSGARR